MISFADNLLWISWHDSAWIPILNPTNVMDYFQSNTNPFYDRTCNNEIVKMQRLNVEHLRYTLYSFSSSYYNKYFFKFSLAIWLDWSTCCSMSKSQSCMSSESNTGTQLQLWHLWLTFTSLLVLFIKHLILDQFSIPG